ncbi:transcription cofactor vestigial 4 [Labeo rohita]|uniref:Transcription cofactor vestigial 4 n=1 Tax=Labeo rohita TaxID=84645 RepID=A0A498NX08_LABRO|nr:transcription cofactor vestigial 4 [Labeo rohita]
MDILINHFINKMNDNISRLHCNTYEANTACDPVIEEHFRRSLGKIYEEPAPVSNSVCITGSVDDHFTKALGDAWLQIKAKGNGGTTPDDESP